MTNNECAKKRDVNEPYEIWWIPFGSYWVWRVLKKYQADDTKENARWFCAVKSPSTPDTYELGDVYVSQVTKVATKMGQQDMRDYLTYYPW